MESMFLLRTEQTGIRKWILKVGLLQKTQAKQKTCRLFLLRVTLLHTLLHSPLLAPLPGGGFESLLPILAHFSVRKHRALPLKIWKHMKSLQDSNAALFMSDGEPGTIDHFFRQHQRADFQIG